VIAYWVFTQLTRRGAATNVATAGKTGTIVRVEVVAHGSQRVRK
jgi:hypothetical protein